MLQISHQEILFKGWVKVLKRHYYFDKDPDGEIDNSGKSILEIRIPNFCYIQVIVFDLSFLSVAAIWTKVSTLTKYKKSFSQFFHGSVLKSQSLPLVNS